MVAIECLYHIIDHVTIMLWLQRNHIQNAAFIIIASLATQNTVLGEIPIFIHPWFKAQNGFQLVWHIEIVATP